MPMNITFSEGSGLNGSIYGECQAPIRMFVEQRGEQFEQTTILPELFLMGESENFGDMLSSMTAMEGFQPVGENGAYPADSMQVGYEKFLRYVTWKDSFSISAEMIEDGKLMDLTKQPAAFMTSYGRTRELFGANLFASAIKGERSIKFRGHNFDATAADGLPIFHTAHKPKVSGKQQSNRFSNVFSKEALDMAESAMHLFRGDNDNILDVAPTTILIPESASLKREVFEVIGADKDPDTEKNGFNYQFGRWNVIVWSYLNQFLDQGLKPWILLDDSYNKTYGGAVWNDRLKLYVRSTIDENTDANVWRGRSRFNAAFNDWRFACVGGMEGGTDLATLKL